MEDGVNHTLVSSIHGLPGNTDLFLSSSATNKTQLNPTTGHKNVINTTRRRKAFCRLHPTANGDRQEIIDLVQLYEHLLGSGLDPAIAIPPEHFKILQITLPRPKYMFGGSADPAVERQQREVEVKRKKLTGVFKSRSTWHHTRLEDEVLRHPFLLKERLQSLRHGDSSLAERRIKSIMSKRKLQPDSVPIPIISPGCKSLLRNRQELIKVDQSISSKLTTTQPCLLLSGENVAIGTVGVITEPAVHESDRDSDVDVDDRTMYNSCENDGDELMDHEGADGISEIYSTDLTSYPDSWVAYCELVHDRQGQLHPGYSHQSEWDEFTMIYKGKKLLLKNEQLGDWLPSSKLFQIQVFYPSLAMMEPFNRFVHFMDWMGCGASGFGKVFPPPDWNPRSKSYQSFLSNKNLSAYSCTPVVVDSVARMSKEKIIPDQKFSLQTFYENFVTFHGSTRKILDGPAMIDWFWSNLFRITSIHVKGESVTGFDPERTIWNLTTLRHIWERQLDAFYDEENKNDTTDDRVGLIKHYICISHFLSSFCDHVKDYGAYSLSFLHFGDKKFWRFVPPSFFAKYTLLLKKMHLEKFPECTDCSKLCMHKKFLLPDNILDENCIPYSWVEQETRTFIVTWPHAFHCGFSSGFSCGETTNFVLEDDSWTASLLFDVGCRKMDCLWGNGIRKSLLALIKQGLTNEEYLKFLKGELLWKNPFLLPHQHSRIPVPSIPAIGNFMGFLENCLPTLPWKMEKETLYHGLLVRRFFASVEDIGKDTETIEILKNL